MIVVLLFVIAITFLIFFILPTADPAALRAGRSPTPETLKAIREQLGLDKSVPEQFWLYVKGLVLHFDFGNSFINDSRCARRSSSTACRTRSSSSPAPRSSGSRSAS